MISTEEINRTSKKHWCYELGVEDFELEFLHDGNIRPVHSEDLSVGWFSKKTRERTFLPPHFRWKIGGKWFYGYVPVHLKTNAQHSWLGSEYRGEYDFDKMMDEARQMVHDSIKMINDDRNFKNTTNR